MTMETLINQEREIWGPINAFTDLQTLPQLSDDHAYCSRIAIANNSGEWTRQFQQGERAHFYFEFQILKEVQFPAAGVEIIHEDGTVAHGKNMLQHGLRLPDRVAANSILRCHVWCDVRLCPGTYTITVGLAGTDRDAYERHTRGDLPYEQFAPHLREHCRVIGAATVQVGYRADGALTHHGLADLPGGADLQICTGALYQAPSRPTVHEGPPVFHITHWKAGSQWIYRILSQCLPDRIVVPQPEQLQVRRFPIQRGHAYPTVYLTKGELDKIGPPSDSKRFVVIRDLRDTLVSAYFSFKISHPIMEAGLLRTRNTLLSLNEEEGLLYLLEDFLALCADIQLSWLESDELVLKYEDLLNEDLELLEHALIRHCGLPIDPQRLKEAVIASRFEAVTRGRVRGVEDQSAHERKGVAGDWRKYFTPRLKNAFNARFGGLLVAAGYERDLEW